jgi:hypothetical protein
MLESQEEWVGNHRPLAVRAHWAAPPLRGPPVLFCILHAQR